MTILTIQLPDDVVARLNAKATARHQKLDTFMSEVLTHESEQLLDQADNVELRDIVDLIRSLPPRSSEYIRPASASLKDALTQSKVDPEFNEAAWNRNWESIETEIKRVDSFDLREDQLRDRLHNDNNRLTWPLGLDSRGILRLGCSYGLRTGPTWR